MPENAIVDKDRGYRELTALVRDLGDGVSAEAGIFEPQSQERYPGGSTVVEVAIANEFGTSDIPERSFMRSTTDENARKYADQTGDVIGQAIDRRQADIDRDMQELADEMATDMRQKIYTLRRPPNAPETLQDKRGNNPLVDTGRLANSISGRVVKGAS